MGSKNAIVWWDGTVGMEFTSEEWVKAWLQRNCKEWGYQGEEGTKTGYQHWQIRLNLKIKVRSMVGKICSEVRWSPTNLDSVGNFDYVTKDHTRISGPFLWTDKIPYIPAHIRNKEPYPWQKYILDDAGLVERIINVVLDTDGCKGKSILAAMARAKGYITIPCIGDAERLIATACDIMMGKQVYSPDLVIIDIPRAVNKNRLGALFTVIEKIKDGWVYDTRNRYREWTFDPPSLWIMTNSEIPIELLSKDRWKIWEIKNQKLCSLADKHLINSGPPAHCFEESKFDYECQLMNPMI